MTISMKMSDYQEQIEKAMKAGVKTLAEFEKYYKGVKTNERNHNKNR